MQRVTGHPRGLLWVVGCPGFWYLSASVLPSRPCALCWFTGSETKTPRSGWPGPVGSGDTEPVFPLPEIR